jgi:hypothetical protein
MVDWSEMPFWRDSKLEQAEKIVRCSVRRSLFAAATSSLNAKSRDFSGEQADQSLQEMVD